MANQPSGAGVGIHDWARSFHGLSAEPFSKEVSDVLLAPVDPRDVEIKPGTCTSKLGPWRHADATITQTASFTFLKSNIDVY
jgi:hypothetical protein